MIKSNLDGACFEPVGIRQDEENRIYLCNPRENGNENQIDLATTMEQRTGCYACLLGQCMRRRKGAESRYERLKRLLRSSTSMP